MLPRIRLSLPLAMLVAVCAGRLAADDVFYEVRLSELNVVEGTFDEPRDPTAESNWRNWNRMKAYVVLEGEGEAYERFGTNFRENDITAWGSLVVRSPKGGDITGRLFYPNRAYTGLRMVKFKIPADRARPEARRPFYEGKQRHYDTLLGWGVPGAAWFRHQRNEAQLALTGAAATPNVAGPQGDAFRPLSEFDDTYSLFTGGRAISENLQLERVLLAARADETSVKLDTIAGITIKEIDWKAKNLAADLDPLATYIPADQHVVFFPTFEAMVRLSDEADRQGTPLLQLAEPQSQDVGVVARYQRQIGLKTTTIGRMLGPTVIKSVALTGGDPYFRVGTDVALVFEPHDLDTLRAMLIGQITLNTAGEKNVARGEGTMGDGIAYVSWRSPDRTVSSYLAAFGNVVVVTNSPAQLKRLIEVFSHASPSIASLDEYKFFRNRYPRGADGETAFLLITDATIRRWCGPEWRIADSRRTRDLAVLSELQAASVTKLAAGKIESGPLYTNFGLSRPGELRLTETGVVSDALGTIDFMTPISELRPLVTVAKSEAAAYERWRDGYQRNFSWAFDPIALRITATADKLAGDLTVMPLIANSEYREFIAVSSGAALKPTSGDPHDAVFHAALAINMDSQRMKDLSGLARGFLPQLAVDPFSWIGESISVYADESPLWDELAKLKTYSEREDFAEEHGYDFPIAVNIEVESAFKAAAFLTALHGFVDQSAPGMSLWSTRQHNDVSYVRVGPSPGAVRAGSPEERLAIYYVLNAESLTISPSEDLIKRVIDRYKARTMPATAEGPAPAEAAAAESDKPTAEKLAAVQWLGESFCLEAGERAMTVFASIVADDYQAKMQGLSWSNLPILNEWHAMHPDVNPVELHKRLWGVKLLCPGGGEYVWNEKFQTMESTVYGHPGEPKKGPAVPAQLGEFARARFGLTFEPEGLRAKAELHRKK